MGFDLLLGSGPTNALLSPALMGCVAEVRVEQKLDEPTTFAVRFLDDIVPHDTDPNLRKGQLMKPQLPELKIGELLSIVVDAGDGQYACLCRGPILETDQQVTQGGPGSWFEVRGTDRRDELGRNHREGAWAGRASDIAQMLLQPVYSARQVDATTETHDQEGKHLPQRGSDLEFLTKNAAENGFHFWVTYSAVAEALTGALSVTETAHWQASPPLQDNAPPVPLPPLPLAPDALTIRVNVPHEQCPNTTSFRLSRDGSRPTELRAVTQNTADGQSDGVTVQDRAAAMGGQGQGLSSNAPARFIPPRPQGNAETARTINAAALREAGFFVKGEVSTTRHLLTGVLQPHQVIAVEGLGQAAGNVPFRVAEVVHVINGINHFMDAKIETNAELDV